jgi:hypothetical protein
VKEATEGIRGDRRRSCSTGSSPEVVVDGMLVLDLAVARDLDLVHEQWCGRARRSRG